MRRVEERAPLRELFIEELVDVTGGTGEPLEKVMWLIREHLVQPSTMACGEEGPGC